MTTIIVAVGDRRSVDDLLVTEHVMIAAVVLTPLNRYVTSTRAYNHRAIPFCTKIVCARSLN